MGRLFLVPTPIGNLEDMTQRALRVLSEVDLILCEDTRKTGILLKKFGIGTRMMSHHKFNEHHTIGRITDRLRGNENMALVTDAGTPGISDPGFLIVRHCLESNISVECLPGATAFIPALVISGLSCDRFCFEGFLPLKKGREKRFRELENETRTMVFYESPHRLVKTLGKMVEVFGPERPASVSRELTKMYEETQRSTLEELHQYFQSKNVKGELVIVVSGRKKSE